MGEPQLKPANAEATKRGRGLTHEHNSSAIRSLPTEKRHQYKAAKKG
jgi:hypothetical protein